MKKNVLAALMVGVAVMAAGCGSKNTDTKETDAKVTEAAAENATEAGVAAEEETKTEAAEETEAEAQTDAETAETEAETAAETAEAETADGEETEGVTESISEEAREVTEEELAERPDYKALDYVTLGTYKGLSIVQEPIQVTDSEIDQEILLRVQDAGLDQQKEGTVKDGDTVNIDFVGKLDGEAFAGGTGEGYDLVIGSHSFIDGFEDGLIGASVGDTLDLDLTFPEDYYNSDLAGKETVFTITVNFIRVAPEITEDLIAQISDGSYSTTDSYRDYIREQLVSRKEEEQENSIYSELITQLYNTCTVNDYPKELVDYSIASVTQSYKVMAEEYGMEFPEFLNSYFSMDEDQFAEEVEEYVKQNLQIELILRAIAEQEEMTISDEEYQAGCEGYVEKLGYESVEELEKAFDRATIENSLLMDKAFDLVRENAVIEEPETETESESETEALEAVSEAADTEEAVTEAAETEATETESEVVKEAVSETESE